MSLVIRADNSAILIVPNVKARVEAQHSNPILVSMGCYGKALIYFRVTYSYTCHHLLFASSIETANWALQQCQHQLRFVQTKNFPHKYFPLANCDYSVRKNFLTSDFCVNAEFCFPVESNTCNKRNMQQMASVTWYSGDKLMWSDNDTKLLSENNSYSNSVFTSKTCFPHQDSHRQLIKIYCFDVMRVQRVIKWGRQFKMVERTSMMIITPVGPAHQYMCKCSTKWRNWFPKSSNSDFKIYVYPVGVSI